MNEGNEVNLTNVTIPKSIFDLSFDTNLCHLFVITKIIGPMKRFLKSVFSHSQIIKLQVNGVYIWTRSFDNGTYCVYLTHTSRNKIIERKIVNIFLSICFIICFGCSKEPSHGDGSFEYPQHMFWLRNKKNIFFYYRPAYI